MKQAKSIVIGAALAALAPMGCGGNDASGPLGNVDALIILQRPSRNDGGDIFQYTSYIAGAKLVKLSPPTADGTLTVLCCDAQGPEFANIDIMAYDLSFDAKEVVFAGKLGGDQTYGLFLLELDTGAVTQIATDPGRDFVMPIWTPGDNILFTSNDVVEAGAPQFQDEYERGTTSQVGTVHKDGTGLQLGARNLSHRAHPALASDGRVIMTEWRHLGPVNEGDLVFMNSDMTVLREAFGREGTEASNSTLKAQEISPGRFVAVATSRDRTIQAGALVDIRLGFTSTDDSGVLRADDQMSEAHASYVMLTPQVPTDRSPSANTIGRYYDAYPLNGNENPDLLVSWADGPVESGVLGAAGLNANFGVYLYDTKNQERHPILDDPNMWDIFARPLQPRTAPPLSSSVIDPSLHNQAVIGALNVYDSTLHTFNPGEVFGVRIMEGFSSEGGGPRMFGTTMFEGHADLGIAPVFADGSWLATVPANIPLHLQAIDNFGMSLFNEPVWFSARAGESRVCGGCHEDRAKTTVINPGSLLASTVGPAAAMGTVARANRISTDADLADVNLISVTGDRNATLASAGKLIGMGWSKAIQPIFDGRCTTCHDGTPGPANPSYQIVDPATGLVVFSFTFNLTSTPVMIPGAPGEGPQTYPASYIAVAGVDMEAVERGNLMITGTYKPAGLAMDSRESDIITHVNPTQIFPTPSATRAFATTPHSQAQGYTELSPAEFLRLITVIDNGLNFYSRETAPGGITD